MTRDDARNEAAAVREARVRALLETLVRFPSLSGQESEIGVLGRFSEPATAYMTEKFQVDVTDRGDQTLVDSEDERHGAAGNPRDDVRRPHEETAARRFQIARE